MINVKVAVNYKPDPKKLTWIAANLGLDYDKKVLNNIVSETVRGVVAHYTSQELISQRKQISTEIRESLKLRAAEYAILIDEFSLESMKFSDAFQKSIESKQMAEQKAERAKFKVQKALEDAKTYVVTAEGNAKSIELIGQAVKENPGIQSYLTHLSFP